MASYLAKSSKVMVLKIILSLAVIAISFGTLAVPAQATHTTGFSLSPSQGTFTIGSTFDVSIFLDTHNLTINTLSVEMVFPSDTMQLVSPSAGKSIIGVWVTPPEVNNQTGVITLKGVIPGGIATSDGLVARFTFRAKAVGTSVLKFGGDTQIFLHDGDGTEAPLQTQSAVYQFILPPPQGPIVTSSTHPDQLKWYPNATAVVSWAPEAEVEGYSYILSNEPVDIPDDIVEGTDREVAYKNVSDAKYYFHIKSLRDSVWGGTTHFALNIDTKPPAVFPVEILPEKRTTKRQPIIQFSTTDQLSGVDYYELRIISLSPSGVDAEATAGNQPLFFEVKSPYIMSPLPLGAYDITIRVHDKAGNYTDSEGRAHIVKPFFTIITEDGLELSEFIIPWWWVLVSIGLAVLFLVIIAWRIRRWHKRIHDVRERGDIPRHVGDQLQKLKEYKKQYGKGVQAALWFILLFLGQFFVHGILFAKESDVAPPVITTVSRAVSNEDIFYVGGKANVPDGTVIIYLQNLESGETFSLTTNVDKNGDWFYRHTTFLSSGNYLLWTQSKLLSELSPPSPQIQVSVQRTALQFGASRLSYEVIYFVGFVLSLFVVFGLIIYTAFHLYHGRKKHALLLKEIGEAQESVRRGFAVLRRDIEAELAFIHQLKLSKELSLQEKAKEEQMQKDIAEVEEYIGKEIWDIEEAEQG